VVCSSVGLVGDLPDKARQLAGDGSSDGGVFLAAARVEGSPAAVQPQLGAPGGIDRGRWLVVLAAAKSKLTRAAVAGNARPPR
jgi:hypothetical protein